MAKYTVRASALVDYNIDVTANSAEEAMAIAMEGNYSAWDVTEVGQSDWEYLGAEVNEDEQLFRETY